MTSTYTAPVALSQVHAGQAVEHSAGMAAEGRDVPAGRTIFGVPRTRWAPIRWQATHYTRQDGTESEAHSPWCATKQAAEAWLESRGLLLDGGPYWRMAGPAAA
jgi:hypothetical protein